MAPNKKQMGYSMVRVPRPYRDQAASVQKRFLEAQVAGTLPPKIKQLLDPTHCAACSSKDVERVSVHFVRCKSCGASKHIVEVSGSLDTFLKGVGIAALFGLGIYALDQLLGPKTLEKSPAEAKPPRKPRACARK